MDYPKSCILVPAKVIVKACPYDGALMPIPATRYLVVTLTQPGNPRKIPWISVAMQGGSVNQPRRVKAVIDMKSGDEDNVSDSGYTCRDAAEVKAIDFCESETGSGREEK